MTTAEKRKYFEKMYPELLRRVFTFLDAGEYRQLDRMMNEIDYSPTAGVTNPFILQYIITLMTDELIAQELILDSE